MNMHTQDTSTCMCTHIHTEIIMDALKKNNQSKRLERGEGQGNGYFRLSGRNRPKMSGTMPCAGGSSSEQTRSDSCLQGVFNLEMKTKIKLPA